MAPEICPNCGATVPREARACPECGSDDKTGWSEESYASGLELPDENFDYKDFVEREFGSKKPIPHGIHWFWWAVGLLLVIGFLLYWFW